MRVNPVTRTPTPRYAPGRRRRACHQTPTRIRGPTRESADPRADRGPAPVIADPGAKCRIHVRGEERRQLARLEQFRMQFDWVNFQQYLQTLQFQRYGRAARHSVGGIACDIRGKLTGRDSCATTHSAASSTAGSAATGAGGGLAQRPGTVDTVAANDLPKSHRDRSRDHAQTHNLTTTSNTNFPVPTSRKVTTQPTRFVP